MEDEDDWYYDDGGEFDLKVADFSEKLQEAPLSESKSPLDIARHYLETVEYPSGTGLDTYGYVDANGTVKGTGYGGCHARINEYFSHHEVVWSRSYGIGTRGAYNSPLTKAEQLAFYTWILGPDSPWRGVNPEKFNPDPIWAAKYGVVIGDLEKQSKRLLYNFFIALRFATEWDSFCKRWHTWVLAGVHPGLAMATTTLDGYGPGHGAFNLDVDPVRVAKGDFNEIEPFGLWKQSDAPERGGNALWGGNWEVPFPRKPLYRGASETRPSPPADDDEVIAILLKEQERLGLV